MIVRWLLDLMGGDGRTDSAREARSALAPTLPPELVWPAVKITPVKSTRAKSSSRFGGGAVLPAGVPWPMNANRPLDLLLELDCRQLHGLETGLPLPKEGALLFFYDLEAQPWGSREDIGGWQVIYRPPEATPEEVTQPAALPVAGMRLEEILTYPDAWSPWLEAAALTADERFALSEHYSDQYNEAAQIGGHPSIIQNPMEIDCELASCGVELSREVYDSPIGKEAQGKTRDWRLLLQLPSDDDLGMIFGDYGSVYFWIRTDDLRAGNFSRVWLQLQTT